MPEAPSAFRVLKQNRKYPSRHAVQNLPADARFDFRELPRALRLDRLGYLPAHCGGNRARPAGVAEHVNHQKARAPRKVKRFAELRVGLLRKTHDHIGGELYARHGAAQASHALQCHAAVVFPLHPREHRIRSALHGKVKMRGEGSQSRNAVDKFLFHQRGIKRTEANPFQSLHAGNHRKQVGKVATVQIAPVGGCFDSRQHHLAASARNQCAHFLQDCLRALGTNRTARSGNDAVGASVLAAVLDFDVGAGAV